MSVDGYRTPLARARGLGSAKHGVGHFIGQRVSAVALIFLALWGVWSAVKLSSGDFALANAWLRSPLNATLLGLVAVAAFYHMQIGMRVIVEDYIHRGWTKAVLLIANLFVCWAGGALAVVCILKVALGVGAL
ncbi:MAG TPA: succinate dehydrogenase, hydrophobic membrane anchor protein [Caulobacteraceae bacterium]